MTAIYGQALQIFLGELRAGADVMTATVVAEMSIEEGRRHAEAEERGEYPHVVPIEPPWALIGDRLSFAVTRADN